MGENVRGGGEGRAREPGLEASFRCVCEGVGSGSPGPAGDRRTEQNKPLEEQKAEAERRL